MYTTNNLIESFYYGRKNKMIQLHINQNYSIY